MLFLDADVLVLYYFAPPNEIMPGARSGLALIPGLLTLLWLRIFTQNAGVSYQITNSRIVRKQELPIFKRTTEKPLNSIVSIRTKRALGRGHITFVSADTSTLSFINLKTDPEPIREVAEKAIYATKKSPDNSVPTLDRDSRG